MASTYEIGHAVGAAVAKTYERGLGDLADSSALKRKRKARMVMAVKIWNAGSKQGLRGMQGAELLKDVGFTAGEVRAVVQLFLNKKES